MQLQLQNFSALVTGAAAAVQGAARQLVDLSVGSTLRAMLEASASMALWLQWLILQMLQMTRAATSVGSDLDSWMADFTVSRLPAVAAAGTVTFSRFVAVAPALVPAGTNVLTADGTQTFQVIAASTVAGYSAAQNGYVLVAGQVSIDVPVAAVVAGGLGNVQAGVVTQIAAALPGVDTVTNGLPFQGGLDAESDAAFRARFQTYLASRSRATPTAVGYAVASVQQGLQYTIEENALPSGGTQLGSFVVTVDDGTGNPPNALLTSVAAAIEPMRPIGTTFAVQPPVVSWATISMTVTVTGDAVHAVVAAAVVGAITGYVDALPIGTPLPWSRLTQQAYQASALIGNVGAVLLNGGTADLVPPASGVVKAAGVTVN